MSRRLLGTAQLFLLFLLPPPSPFQLLARRRRQRAHHRQSPSRRQRARRFRHCTWSTQPRRRRRSVNATHCLVRRPPPTPATSLGQRNPVTAAWSTPPASRLRCLAHASRLTHPPYASVAWSTPAAYRTSFGQRQPPTARRLVNASRLPPASLGQLQPPPACVAWPTPPSRSRSRGLSSSRLRHRTTRAICQDVRSMDVVS